MKRFQFLAYLVALCACSYALGGDCKNGCDVVRGTKDLGSSGTCTWYGSDQGVVLLGNKGNSYVETDAKNRRSNQRPGTRISSPV